ncbi:hypothetical protein D3C86_2106150 [compost metagenome]
MVAEKAGEKHRYPNKSTSGDTCSPSAKTAITAASTPWPISRKRKFPYLSIQRPTKRVRNADKMAPGAINRPIISAD